MYLAQIHAYNTQKIKTVKSKLLRKFELDIVLGAGAFGVVLKATNKFDTTSYAIKILVESNAADLVEATNEIKVLSKISSHQNVVSYKASWVDAIQNTEFQNVLRIVSMKKEEIERLKFNLLPCKFNIICIQMELCGPDLRFWLRNSSNSTDEIDAGKHWRMFCQLVKGLKHIHRCNIIHRDLKPDNIYVCEHQVKIGDLGISRALSTTANIHSNLTITGTKAYMAPEQTTSKYGKSVDIYSLGLILLELFSTVKTNEQLLSLQFSARCGVIPLHITEQWQKISNLILKMVENDPDKRIHLDDISKLCKVIKCELAVGAKNLQSK